MRKILTFAAVLAMAALAWGAGPTTPPAKKKAPARKPGAAPVASAARKAPSKVAASTKPPVRTPATATNTTATARRGKKPPPKPTTTWRNRQTAPTSDRYKEIQAALVDKGYLSTEAATGSWDTASADALKRFQAEQNLESTGKINSLSLIALGLGPRHEAPAAKQTIDVNVPQPESGRIQ